MNLYSCKFFKTQNWFTIVNLVYIQVKEMKKTCTVFVKNYKLSGFIKLARHTILPFSQTGFIPFAILEINIFDKTIFFVFQLLSVLWSRRKDKHYQKSFKWDRGHLTTM